MFRNEYVKEFIFRDVLNQDLENIVRWVSHNKLQLHTKKTKFMFIGSYYNFKNEVGNEFNDK